MDNDIIDNDDMVDELSVPSDPESKSIALSWRIGIAVVALIVIAFLAFRLLNLGSNNNDSASPETNPDVAVPKATAQADPSSAQAQFELGNSYAQGRQLEQALTAYQKAIELDPEFQAAYANLGVVYYQLGQLDLAALQYEKALELDPKDGEVSYNLGALYLQRSLQAGDQPDPEALNEAITQLEHSLELAPDLAEPYFTLGVAYATLNQKDKAIEAFETFLDRDTGQDPRASQDAQRYVETLQSE